MHFFKEHKKAISLICVILSVALFIIITVFIGNPLVKYASNPEKFREWINSFGIFGRIIFIAIVVLQVVVAFIPGEPFEIAAGYCFGSIWGMLLCLTGIFIGSVIIFFAVRKFGRSLVEIFFSEDKINTLSNVINSRKFGILYFILMFIPGTPKDLLSYFAGLTDMKPYTFFIIVLIGRIPSVITSTVGGNALSEKKYLFAIIIFSLTLILSAAGMLIYDKINRKKEKDKNVG